ncbi:MAG: multicopper oxidase family protein, partial [Beijerinckiaceae bacterium]
ADLRIPLRDTGFYLYHPMVPGSTAGQLDAGLYGGIIVSEASPPQSDKEIVVILDDWRLNAESQLELPQMPSSGQNPPGGNLLTVNGAPRAAKETAAPGSRLRLYIANAATTRIVTLKFEGAPVTIVAIDGQPSSTAFQPKGALALLTPGGRMELFVDLPAAAGQTFRITTALSPEVSVPVLEVETSGDPVKTADRGPIRPLPQNAMPDRLDLARAQRVDCIMGGGAGANNTPPKPWTLNGARAGDWTNAKPLFRARPGTTVVIAFRNDTLIPQPMTVHGHHGRLLFVLDDGWDPFWTDTVLVQPGRTARFAFVADNPGRWLVRSAYAALFDAGMAAPFEVG